LEVGVTLQLEIRLNGSDEVAVLQASKHFHRETTVELPDAGNDL